MQEKECTQCKTVNPLSEFYKNQKTKDEKTNACKTCIKANQKALYDFGPRTKHKKRFRSDTHRECSQCEEVKSLSYFSGEYGYCKPCRSAAYQNKKDHMKNTETHKECRGCGELKRFAKFKSGKQLNHTYCIDCRRERGFEANLERYGLTPEQYVEMFDKQDGVCAICKKPEVRKKRLSIDHDHSCCSGLKSCGKCIRGLLCSMCNNGLGSFRDNASVLRAAADYLS